MQMLHVLINWNQILVAFSSLYLNRHLVAHFLWTVLWEYLAVLLVTLFVIFSCPWHDVFIQAASLVLWLLQLTWRGWAGAFTKQTDRTFPHRSLSSSPEREEYWLSFLQVLLTTCVVPAQLNFTVVCGWWKHKVLPSWISWACLPVPALLLLEGTVFA